MSYGVSITEDDTVLQTAGKYVAEDIVVGMADSIKLPAQTFNPSTTDQVIPAGKFLSGAQTIKGDANLVGENIRSGKSIFGVPGTLTPGITPTGTKNITANGTYDVSQYASAAVNVPQRVKRFYFSSPTAVATQNVKIVSGDSDVAAHYADDTAYCIVRKLGTITGNGLVIITNSNIKSPLATGTYSNYNGAANNTNNVAYAMKESPLSTSTGVINATSDGDIYVRCGNLQNNFGGAEYDIIFLW